MKRARFLLPAMVLVLVLFTLCGCKEKATNGDKMTVTLTVTHADKTVKEFTVVTRQKDLRHALEDEKLISGNVSATGLFITTVDGETADYSVNESWWKLSKNGVDSLTGADECILSDGDRYELTYMIGY